MRVVVYSDEDMEPITVLRLPITERDLAKHGYRCRVPVPFSLRPMTASEIEYEGLKPMRIVDLWFERFRRNTPDGREQESWMCFTKADGLAMLLNPAWLPGQLSAIRYLEDQNDALTKMLMRVLG